MTDLAVYASVAQVRATMTHILATVNDMAALAPRGPAEGVELDAAWRLAEQRGEEIADLRRLVAQLCVENHRLRGGGL